MNKSRKFSDTNNISRPLNCW